VAAYAAAEQLERRVLFAATITGMLTMPATVQSGSTESLIVTYRDTDMAGAPISGLAVSNLTIGGSSAPTVTAVSATTIAGTTGAVTYTVSAPGGGNWTAAEDGNYTVSLAGNSTITDADMNTAGTGMPTLLGHFTVNVDVPTAALTSAPEVTAPAASTTVVITYSDAGGADIDLTTVNNDNITITGTGNNSAALMVTGNMANVVTNGPVVIVTYTVAPTNGMDFTASEDGTYTIGESGNVQNTVNQAVTGNATFGTFQIAIVDAPTALPFTPPADVTTEVPSETFTITYVDAGPATIDPTTVRKNNITITGTGNNASTLEVTSATTSATADSATVTATYTVAPADGSLFQAGDNGTYTIGLTDTLKNTVPAGIVPNASYGTFNVEVADLSTPAVSATAANIDISAINEATVIVTYTSAVGIDTSTIDSSNITIVGNNGESLDINNPTPAAGTIDGQTTVVVTYTAQSAEGGSLTSADNGTYTVNIVGGVDGVADSDGNAVLATPDVASFTIDIPNTTRPQAEISAPEISTVGQTSELVTVVLTDNVNINVGSIGVNDLSIVNEVSGETLKATGVSFLPTTNSTLVTAVFTIAAPATAPDNGVFTGHDDGLFILTLSGVNDVSGLTVNPVTSLGDFEIDIAVPATPPVQIGQVGIIDGKVKKFSFRDIPEGTNVTMSVQNGTGTVFEETDGEIDLDLTDNGKGLKVNVQTTTNMALTFNNVTITGNVRSFQGSDTNVVGTFYCTGSVEQATIRQLVGTLPTQFSLGVFAAAGDIGTLTVEREIADATITSGVNLGPDDTLGTADDSFYPGSIGAIHVGQAIIDSGVFAGDSPGPDKIFGTSDDVRAGAVSSPIDKIIAPYVDGLSHFYASAFGIFKFGKTKFVPNPAADGRFKLLQPA
jgi:hypothetical protein